VAFASRFNWTPRQIEDLYLDEFWDFIETFEKWAKEERRKSRYHPEDGDPTHWIRDPKYRT